MHRVRCDFADSLLGLELDALRYFQVNRILVEVWITSPSYVSCDTLTTVDLSASVERQLDGLLGRFPRFTGALIADDALTEILEVFDWDSRLVTPETKAVPLSLPEARI